MAHGLNQIKDGQMKDRRENWINDEAQLPSLTKDFFKNAKKHLEEKSAKDSSQNKSQETYVDSLVEQIKADRPHLSEKRLREEIKSFW
jgi:hypothetical protein